MIPMTTAPFFFDKSSIENVRLDCLLKALYDFEFYPTT